jgi:hypothetical protein
MVAVAQQALDHEEGSGPRKATCGYSSLGWLHTRLAKQWMWDIKAVLTIIYDHIERSAST